MRIRIMMPSSSLWLLLVGSLCFPSGQAFVPSRGRSFSPHGSTSNSALAARYMPPLPPPPPPPPPSKSQVDAVLDNLLQRLTENTPDFTGATTDGTNVVEFVRGLLEDLVARVAAFHLPSLPLLSSLPSLSSLSTVLPSLQTSLQEALAQVVTDSLLENLPPVQEAMRNIDATLEPYLRQLEQSLGPAINQSPELSLVVSAIFTYVVVSSVLSWDRAPPPSQPYPANKYDPIAARAYFDSKLHVVAGRGLEIMIQSLRFASQLAQDKVQDRMQETEFQRGKELAELLTRLGPTFIKVGQSLSIRTDLLSPAYIRGLETLQDQVPAFDTGVAKQILEQEWGRPVEAVLESMPAKPIAAASLGQVYRAKLKSTGQEVAIKVQRPNIMSQIALDMHLLREIAPIVKRLGGLNSDTVGTVDAWGAGFVDELDYLAEAENAAFFMDKIADTPLSSVVFAPKAVDEYSTGAVLVTEWVDGQRLDVSSAADVTVLCSIAMNTYLTMLLELGLLHCDPHPGNLLRTSDGRLCILDWGMVTRLNPDLQLTLIEHVAHLTSKDYAEIPRDLLLLDFIPANKANLIQDSGVVEVLADIYGQWSSGGGAAAINVQDVVNSLQDLTAEKGNLFQIPPYFAYIAKSFSVLEGIGLSNDPKYSIINECLPYVSQRLLTDDEKCGPALSTFVFGPKKAEKDRFVDYDRVEQLVEGFGQYTTSASGALLGRQNASRLELLEDSADQILDLVFVEKETPLQTIMLEQLAKIVASGGRSIFAQAREQSGMLPTGRSLLGTLLDPIGLFRTSPLVRTNDLDRKTIDTTQKLVALAQKQLDESPNPAFDLSDLTREEGLALASILTRKIWERRGGILQTGNRFLRQLLVLTAERLEEGEPDRLSALPPPPSLSTVSNDMITSSGEADAVTRALPQTGTTTSTRSMHQDSASPRLEQARKLLDSYQTEEEVVSYDTVPARLKV